MARNQACIGDSHRGAVTVRKLGSQIDTLAKPFNT
jgi:hypothetical protein